MNVRTVLAAAVFTAACSGADTTDGIEEPLRVWNPGPPLELAQFIHGELPGKPGKEEIEPRVASGTASGGPRTRVGATGYRINGTATEDTASIAMKFEKAGSGYWVIPAGGPDETGALLWKVTLDLGLNAPPGMQNLLLAAIDSEGNSGSQFIVDFCVQPPVPDNLNACNKTKQPPYLVISLDWDRPVDLDLRVVTPTGKIVDSRSPSTADEDETGKSDPTAEGVGIIDRDSNHGCVIDGRQRENLVFQQKPPAGKYLVYARFVDSCGEPFVNYTVSTHASEDGTEPGTFDVAELSSKSGALRAIEAGADKIGAYVTQVVIQ